MPEHDDGAKWKGSTNGDRAWKEATDRVAARNVEARKIGKQEREDTERERADVRRAAAVKRDAGLGRKR